jgi:hypothetical protein
MGGVCKGGNAFSLAVPIDRGLDAKPVKNTNRTKLTS